MTGPRPAWVRKQRAAVAAKAAKSEVEYDEDKFVVIRDMSGEVVRVIPKGT